MVRGSTFSFCLIHGRWDEYLAFLENHSSWWWLAQYESSLEVIWEWMARRFCFACSRQDPRDATASKGKGCVRPSLPGQREVRGHVPPSGLTSWASPPPPWARSQGCQAGSERCLQEAPGGTETSASPAPTCRALGTLGTPDPAPGKSSQKQAGEGGLLPWVPIWGSSFASLSWILLTAERDQIGRKIFESRWK